MRILVDTSVWADHFRAADPSLGSMIAAGRAMMHPFVLGELAMGNLRDRRQTIAILAALPSIDVVDEGRWLAFVEHAELAGSGLGFVDAHLLAAVAAEDAALWTRDRRLADRADGLGRCWSG